MKAIEKGTFYASFTKNNDGTKTLKKFFGRKKEGLENKSQIVKNTKTSSYLKFEVQKYDWIKKKFNDKDMMFSLEHQIQFLNDFFNVLILDYGMKRKKVEEFI